MGLWKIDGRAVNKTRRRNCRSEERGFNRAKYFAPVELRVMRAMRVVDDEEENSSQVYNSWDVCNR